MKGFRLFHSPFPGFAWRTGRVVSGDCSPETPTDPDMQVFRIRLFSSRFATQRLQDGCGAPAAGNAPEAASSRPTISKPAASGDLTTCATQQPRCNGGCAAP